MTEPNRQSGENEERIIEIEIERLRPFKEHSFQVKDQIDSVITEIDNQITKLQGELDFGTKISEEAKEKSRNSFKNLLKI